MSQGEPGALASARAKRGGDERTVDIREVVNALTYALFGIVEKRE